MIIYSLVDSSDKAKNCLICIHNYYRPNFYITPCNLCELRSTPICIIITVILRDNCSNDSKIYVQVVVRMFERHPNDRSMFTENGYLEESSLVRLMT